MTTRSWHGLSVVLLFSAAALGAGKGPKDAQEPPQLFSLEAGGQSTAIELDKPFETNVLGGNPSATLRVRPYRVFPYGGLKFHYPREYTFEADFTQPGVAIWTLSGNTCVIMVQRFKDHKEHDQIRGQVAKEIARTLGGSAKTDRQCSLKLKDQTLRGIGLSAEVGPVKIEQDFYSFSAGGDSIVLVLQDTPDDNGRPSGDRTRAEKMLCETLRLSGE